MFTDLSTPYIIGLGIDCSDENGRHKKVAKN